MTKRNLVVKNGLQVGDVIISATDNTIVGLSTTAPSNPGDVVTKSYSDSGTQTMTNKTLTSPVLNTGVSGTAILDEDTMSSDSDTQLATQQSIKAYVDSKLNTDSTITADSGATTAVVSGSGASGTFTVRTGVTVILLVTVIGQLSALSSITTQVRL